MSLVGKKTSEYHKLCNDSSLIKLQPIQITTNSNYIIFRKNMTISSATMKICLWFDKQAEEAVQFYTSIFLNSNIGAISRYGKESFEFHQMPESTALTVQFRIHDMEFLALNGGPKYTFNEAISIVVTVDTQEEIDYIWEKLTEGGEETHCGWLKDKYGLSWQIVPSQLGKWMSSTDSAAVQRVTAAYLQMQKFDISTLEKAYNG